MNNCDDKESNVRDLFEAERFKIVCKEKEVVISCRKKQER